MGHGSEAGVLDQAFDEIMSAIPGRSRRAVGDRDERWLKRDQFADSAIKGQPARGRRGGEELKGDGGGAVSPDIGHG